MNTEKRPLSAGVDGLKSNGKSKKAKIIKVDYNCQSNIEIMVRTYART